MTPPDDPVHPAVDGTTETVDAVVIGMGPGGEHVAGRLAEAGLDVVGVEAELVGGECPYWGCVPSKMMVRAADLLETARRVPQLSGSSRVEPTWERVSGRIREHATDGWDDAAAAERFAEQGGRLVRGRGRLLAADVVEVGEQRFRARRAVVVATGTSPTIPPIDGLDQVPYWTNRQAVSTPSMPRSMIVLGGGAVGAELAQVFARFGTEVAVIESARRLVPDEEPEVGELLGEVFADDGIEVLTGATVSRVDHDDEFVVTLDGGGARRAERLLVATGRSVDLSALGVQAIGLDPDGSALPTDDHLRVIEGVWAVGDVTGRGNFTHVATHQAEIAAADILGCPHAPADDRAVPRVTFTDPEIGSVGLSVAAAREAGIEVAVGRTRVSSTARGWIHGPGNDGIFVLVADADADELVGATTMGPAGGEVLGLLTLAIHARVPLEQLRTMIYAYPTFHRGVSDALEQLS